MCLNLKEMMNNWRVIGLNQHQITEIEFEIVDILETDVKPD